jgi:flagellar assembly factor FliW
VTDPQRFFADFEVALDDAERERLGLAQANETAVYVTVRASDQLEDFTANLRAPIVIADGRGHQVINQAPGAPLRAALFGELAVEAADAAHRAA